MDVGELAGAVPVLRQLVRLLVLYRSPPVTQWRRTPAATLTLPSARPLLSITDPARAASELVRVLASGGRGLISAWVPTGAIDAMIGVFTRAIAQATGSRPRRFAWHDDGAVAGLFAPYNVDLRWHEGAVEFTAGSPEEYLERQRLHPMSVATAPLLERAGTALTAYAEARAVLRAGNERPDACLATSPYRVIEITAGRARDRVRDPNPT